MNASTANAAFARALQHERVTVQSFGRLSLRMIAFFGLAAFSSLRYSTLVSGPPALRVIGIVVIATAAGGTLALTDELAPRPWAATVLRGILVLATFVLALLTIGVPAHVLTPGGWTELGRGIGRGIDGLEGWTWPYRGGQPWAQLAVLMVLPLALTASACTAFWPSSRLHQTRSLAALAMLVAIFLARAANESDSAWGVQGLVLAVLIAAWLWLPRLQAADFTRAACWLVVCSALALVTGQALIAERSWIDFRSWSPVAVATSFQWDQLYGPIPWPRSQASMFEISESRPSLLRVTSLDRFDGLRFLRSDAAPELSQFDLGASPRQSQWFRQATVTIAGLRSSLLVSAGGVPVAVRWLSTGAPVTVREPDGSVVLDSTPTTGVRYQVVSYMPTPTAGSLRRAPRRYPRAYLPYAQFELPGAEVSGFAAPDLRAEEHARPAPATIVGALAPGRTPASEPAVAQRIEHSPYAPMFALAQRLAAGAPTSYDVAERIEGFLLNNYSYDERVPQERYPLEAFLFQLRRGYCEQFSGAMALMLRMDGIPARVGAGFKPSVYDAASHSWNVRALDAHAWVEVFFSGIGWVAFDPTPAGAPSISSGLSGLLAKQGAFPSSTHSGGGAAGLPARPATAKPVARAGDEPMQLLALAAGLAVLLALTGLGWWLVARRRLQRALAGDGSLAVAELRWALTRLGYPIHSTTTLAELESQLESSGGGGRYLMRLRELRYSTNRSARPSSRERDALRRALGHGGGVLGRWRAMMALPPGAARRFQPRPRTRPH